MATITGLTAARMLDIEDASIVDGEVVGGELILTKYGGATVNAGPVIGPQGPQGPQGPGGGFIPGEVRLWPGSALPLEVDFGTWVWADGAVYLVSNHPLAASYIATQWRTAFGASDPGGSNFRVPDLRGLVPAGLDAMPGGTRANRMTRSIAITIAGKTGEETHIITVPEVPSHNHGGSVNVSGGISGSTDAAPNHAHTVHGTVVGGGAWPNGSGFTTADSATEPAGAHSHGLSGSFSGSGTIPAQGGGSGHENVQPTVFVPYIVYLDG